MNSGDSGWSTDMPTSRAPAERVFRTGQSRNTGSRSYRGLLCSAAPRNHGLPPCPAPAPFSAPLLYFQPFCCDPHPAASSSSAVHFPIPGGYIQHQGKEGGRKRPLSLKCSVMYNKHGHRTGSNDSYSSLKLMHLSC